MAEISIKRSLQSNGQLLPNQKMRTTCNACQQAKIRCSHTYPCDRCESHGYECVYSISQPLGRPAKRKMTQPRAARAGVKVRRWEAEGVDRSTRHPTRRNAGRAPRPAPEERVQRARSVPSRIPSPSTASGSSPSSREESYKSDSSTGTEVTPPEENFQWPSFIKLFSDVPSKHRLRPWDI